MPHFAPPWSVRVLAAVVSIVSWPLAKLPLFAGLALGGLLGRLAFRLMPERRRIAVDNIEMAKRGGGFDPAVDSVATARASFITMGRSGWEALRFYHRGLEPFLPYCSFEAGEEYLADALKEAKAEGCGLMLVTGHLGNWEVMCQYMARAYDFKLSIVGRGLDSPLANLLVSRMRTGQGNEFIDKKGGASEMLRVLRRGGVLGTLIDQAAVVQNEGVAVPFLGREAMTNSGPLRLARRSGVRRVVMVLSRREGARHYATVLPPLELSAGGYSDVDILNDLVKLNNGLGEYIRRHPDQWLWCHRRWKLPENWPHNGAAA